MSDLKEKQKTVEGDFSTLLEDREGPVVTLMVGDTHLLAHRAVLMARSPVFAAMMTCDCLESSSNRIDITDIDPDILQQLLFYLYKEETPQLSRIAPQLFAAADKYDVAALKVQCREQMVRDLTVENAMATLVLAMQHSCPQLKEFTVSFIKAHFAQVMESRGWVETVYNCPHFAVEISRLLALPPTDTTNTSGEMEWKLLQAAKDGAAGELRALLAAGSDVGVQDTNEETPLHWAAGRGHVEVVKCLLQAGPAVNARDNRKQMPLHKAAYSGHVAVVRLLAAASAHLNARDRNGHTPLHLAALKEHTAVATALLQAGADRTITDYGARTPMDLCRNQKIMAILMKKSYKEEMGFELLEAARYGTTEEVRVLLATGAGIGVHDENKMTAVHFAAESGKAEVIRHLLWGGAAVDAMDHHGDTALHMAARKGHVAVVRLLVAASADTNSMNQAGQTPLHCAVQCEQPEVVSALLASGSDKNAKDYFGKTPLRVTNNKGVQAMLRSDGAFH